jgi:ABC-type cobalamin/Fe3+-siderophores transport system ATPase subunit
MKINKITISSILGIDQLTVEAGKFTEISGKNGQGKTSVLEAIKAALRTGHDATLLRKGKEKGEIVLVLDDGAEIQKRITERASTMTMKDADGSKVKRPAATLESLVDMLSVNPIDFLRAPQKDKVRVLLEAMPIVADTEHLSKISGMPVANSQGMHGLAVIDFVRKQVYDDRTGTNRAVKEKDMTINQLRLAMPDEPQGVTGNRAELQAALADALTAKDTELERINQKLAGLQAASTELIQQTNQDAQTTIDIIKAEAQAKIDAVRQETQATLDAERARMNDIESKAAAQRERTINQYQQTVKPINDALAVIDKNINSVAKREQAMETVLKLESELEELKQDSERQTKAIADIDAYKIKLLASLPIPGLEIKDGELLRDGIPFERLNTAQQVDIAVDVAKLRAGELGVVCVDGVELLDSGAFEAFREKAINSGLQLFVSRVSDEDFQVKTD